jgi:hypothetical protein
MRVAMTRARAAGERRLDLMSGSVCASGQGARMDNACLTRHLVPP